MDPPARDQSGSVTEVIGPPWLQPRVASREE